MIFKKLLGQILTDMKIVTKHDLEVALQRQEKTIIEKILPTNIKRTFLVSESRNAANRKPLLGETLMDMGLITEEQLEDALNEQDKTFDAYRSLDIKKLAMAVEIGSTLNSTRNLSDLLLNVMENANLLTNSVASTLMLLDEERGELIFSVPTGPKADQLINIRIPRGKGIAGWVAENEKPVLVSDVMEDPRFFPEIDKISGFKTKSILCVPIIAKDKLIGVLETINKVDGTSFSEEDTLLLGIFASQAALAIENAKYYKELVESEEKYRILFNNSPVGIGIADEQGDIITYNEALLKPGGYSHEDIAKIKNLNELYSDPKEWEHILSKSSKQGFLDETEVLLKRKDGNSYIAIMSLRLVKIGDKNYWQAMLLDITERKRSEKEKEKLINDLQETLSQVKVLKGLLPICAICKKIREDDGYWRQIESYIKKNSEVEFSHGICPECAKIHYPDMDIYND